MLTLIDLFCGCGGLSLGFEAAGFEVLAGNDFDDAALQAFSLNHPRAQVWPGSIEELNPSQLLESLPVGFGELDVLAGGPPCQGFSKNRARRHQQGQFVDDPRNYLFKEFLRFVEGFQPRVVVIENVPEILIKQEGLFAREIETKLASMGYSMSARVLNAAEYGVPQRRKRAIIVAAREGTITFPDPTHGPDDAAALFPLHPYVTIWEAIGDLPSLKEGGGESPGPYASEPFSSFQKDRRRDLEAVNDHVAWTMSAVQRERLSHLAPGDGFRQLPAHLQPKSGYGSAYRRMAKDIPALTITTWMYHPGSGMFFHPVDDRLITLREGARLQSFDDDVQFVGGKVARCKQVGNAVPPVLARALAESIASQLP